MDIKFNSFNVLILIKCSCVFAGFKKNAHCEKKKEQKWKHADTKKET